MELYWHTLLQNFTFACLWHSGIWHGLLFTVCKEVCVRWMCVLISTSKSKWELYGISVLWSIKSLIQFDDVSDRFYGWEPSGIFSSQICCRRKVRCIFFFSAHSFWKQFQEQIDVFKKSSSCELILFSLW